MVGPSAVGSEKGMPSSMQSAPPASRVRMILSVVWRSGSPAVIKGMSAASPAFPSSENFFGIRLMCLQVDDSAAPALGRNKDKGVRLQLHSQVVSHRAHILIASTG